MNPGTSMLHSFSRVGCLVVALVAATLSPSASAQEPSVPAVTGAQVAAVGSATVVRIAVQGEATVSPFRQGDPERLVLDIGGASLAETFASNAEGLVTRIDASNGSDGASARVVLHLASPSTWEIERESGAVIVSLRAGVTPDPLAAALGADAPAKLSGPASVAPVALTTLDFQQRDKVSRVIVGARGVDPVVANPQSNVVTVDFKGATMPESLKRELNTRWFQSAVDSVRASSTRGGTRVTVRLRQGAEYEVKREGELTVLEIQVPGGVVTPEATALGAVQSSLPAAPGTPATSGGQGLSNATGGEILISGSGRKVDAQAVFGAGAGASAPGGYAFAIDAGSNASARGEGTRMSITLQDADIHTVFGLISEVGEVNIVASDEVQGKITVRIKDTPWDEALGAILQAKGLGAQRYGNILRVAPIEKIKAEQQSALEAKKAGTELADLQVYVAPMNYASAASAKEQVSTLLSERGALQVDERGNQLIIKDLEERVAQIRELVKALDKPNREVDIEARFVEASSSFTRSLGIQWGSEVNASGATGYPTGAFFPSDVRVNGGTNALGQQAFYTEGADNLLVDLGASGAAGSVALALGSIPGLIDLNARLSALQSEGVGRVISNPHVRTLDNKTATVSQGARIPFVSVSQGGTQVQFQQAALELKVTPHITTDGSISLQINLTNNRPDFGNTVQGNPAILTKEIETTVLVQDGDTTVLGGVYATNETTNTKKVPFLGSIPFISMLFKNTFREKTQSEMLVFITPHVVPLTAGTSTTKK
jgi:type IV pilus assembly protein PilQ